MLSKIKERIENEMVRGDLSTISRELKTSTATFYNAIRKENFDELRPSEEKYLLALIDFFNKRKADKEDKIKSIKDKI